MILVREGMRVLIQGITGRQGRLHTRLMREYGTNVVSGVTPGKGGRSVEGVPVFDSVLEAIRREGPVDASVVFVPAPYAFDAVMEALEAGIPLVVVITEHIPVHDTMKFVRYAEVVGSIVVGPNTPGIIAPACRVKLGIMPADAFSPGRVAIVSRSGTLTYEIAMALRDSGLGCSVTVGLGGDPVTGLSFVDVLEMLRHDEDTDAVVIVGEIGGSAEEEAAEYIRESRYPKPVVAYVAGRTAPPGKKMGHAGAIVSGGRGTAESKIAAFSEAGVPVAETPYEVGGLLLSRMRS